MYLVRKSICSLHVLIWNITRILLFNNVKWTRKFINLTTEKVLWNKYSELNCQWFVGYSLRGLGRELSHTFSPLNWLLFFSCASCSSKSLQALRWRVLFGLMLTVLWVVMLKTLLLIVKTVLNKVLFYRSMQIILAFITKKNFSQAVKRIAKHYLTVCSDLL